MAYCLEKFARRSTVEKLHGEASSRMAFFIHELKKRGRCLVIPQDRAEEDTRFSPWIIQARFRGIPGEVMVRALDAEGFAVSTGSACSSSSPERPVLAAMGLDGESRLEGARISQGWSTEPADFMALLDAIDKVTATL